MEVERMVEIDAMLDRILDGKPVDRSSLSRHERELIDRLLQASGANVPGLDSPCGDHEAFASGLAAQLAVGDELGPGERVGAFRLLERIGSGGMGVVFLAERVDGEFDQRVALKLLSGTDHDPALFQMFQRERSLLAQLEHPNIARLIDGGATEHHRPWFAMEYIDGRPLHRYANHQELSIGARIRLFLQACDALDHAHRQLILHRDIKPANLLVSDDGVLRVVDFGLGRVFDPENLAGAETTIAAGRMTPGYASPEQARGDPIGIASEVYQLGLVLHVLLTDKLPYEIERGSPYEVARAISEATIQRPSAYWRTAESGSTTARAFGDPPDRIRRALHGDLDNIVLTALASNPQARYASVAALAEDLCRHLDKLPIKARAATRRYRLARFVQRHKPAVTGFAAFVGLLLASLVMLGMLATELATERDKAVEASTTARIEAEKAGQVTDFLVQLFEAADPARALGVETPVGELLERGHAEIDALDKQPPVKAEMLRVMAVVSASLGEYQRAASLLEQAVAVLEPERNDHPDGLAEVLLTQARNYLKLGEYQKAESTAMRAVELASAPQSGTADLAMAVVADIQQMTGRLDSAREILETLIASRETSRSEAFDAKLARSLGIVLARQSRMPAAIEEFRRALAIRRELHGAEHPETTSALGNLGTALMQSGRNQEGMEVIREALEIDTRILGPDHPDLAYWLHQLGTVHRGLGNLDAAETFNREALELRRTAFGNRHPETVRSLYSLATVLSDRGDHRGARGLMIEVLDARRQQFGPSHAQIANALHGLGIIESRMERLEQAGQWLEEALTMRLELFGEDHMSVATSYMALSRMALDQGRSEDCRRLLQKAELIARNNAAPEHPIFNSLAELSTSLNET